VREAYVQVFIAFLGVFAPPTELDVILALRQLRVAVVGTAG